MKEPCIGYSAQARGDERGFKPETRLEVRLACRSIYDDLESRTEVNFERDFEENFLRRLNGRVITCRWPRDSDLSECCKKKMALFVVRIYGTDR